MSARKRVACALPILLFVLRATVPRVGIASVKVDMNLIVWELQIVSDDVVQAVFTPAAHVASAAHAAHGAVPATDQFVPTVHAAAVASHTVLAVVIQAVFTPAVHVAPVVHFAHGALPDPENVVPATHGTPLHTVSAMVVQAVLKPAVHVASAAHAAHGAVPAVDQSLPAVHGASLQVFEMQSQ